MASPKEISQAVAPTKRRLDDADDCGLEEFKEPKTVVRKYPPPKFRIGVQCIRDFPPGCGIIHESLQVERNPSKKLENVDSNIGSLTSHGKDKILNSQPFEDNKSYNFGYSKMKFWDPMEQVVHDFPPVSGIIKETKPLMKNLDTVNSKLMKCQSFENSYKLKSFKRKELGLKKPSICSRPFGKVKFWDPRNDAQISEDTNTVDSRRRKKIRETMIFFDKVYTQLFQENGTKQKGEKIAQWRIPTKAAKIVKQKLKWMSPEKALGQISGVHTCDRFKFRSQLQMVGLHCQPYCGIDYTKINGKNLALSIVDSHRYSNESLSCDELSYSGEGGGAMFGLSMAARRVALDDQKLQRGNLALKNSMKEKSPVRVIKKVLGVGKKNDDMFVYDGLYTVKDCTQKRSSEGKIVFMFLLHKIPGQPQFQKMVNASGIPGDVALYPYSTFQMLN